ncbi:MAG TPA: PAS domain S-box protein [Gaiellales bacterium]|nr:PAS domain S-box protein [Gaiellales bacterium]
MICTACGHENPKANRFCGECGAPLREPAPRVAEEHDPNRIAQNTELEIELRALVQEANASERRLLDVLEGVQLVAVSTDLDGRIRFCNRYLCELSGWTREELLGRAWAETFNDQSTIVQQLAAGRVADHEEAPLCTRSGEIREISWSTTLDRDADGQITGATGIGQDVTERNQAAADLRRLAQQQAALRRVATCVASEIDSSSVFDIVAEEVACLLGGRSANVVRFEPEANAGTMVGSWSRGFRSLPVGSRVTFDGPTAVGQVRRHNRAARVDDYSNVAGEFAAEIRNLGIDASVAAPIRVGGELWGAIVVSTTRDAPLTPDSETRIEEFAELVALGLASAAARAELAASRARIVAAGDAERRRLERNLHDGAQQQLVSLSLALRMARSTVDETSQTSALLDAASDQLIQALAELRELARGIHPAILTDQGLRAAVEALAQRCPVPVELSIDQPRDVPSQVEAASYYVISESLTNTAKYADAQTVRVSVHRNEALLHVEVADDGRGGADRSLGSGLSGLADRVSALGGHLRVVSPAGRGTTVTADLPIAETLDAEPSTAPNRTRG